MLIPKFSVSFAEKLHPKLGPVGGALVVEIPTQAAALEAKGPQATKSTSIPVAAAKVVLVFCSIKKL